MARTIGNGRRKIQRGDDAERDAGERARLTPETQSGIVAVVLFVVAGISLLSFVDLAGPLGREVDRLEGVLFGWVRYLLPILLIAIGALLLRAKQNPIRGTTYLGLILLTVSVAGIAHLFFDADAAIVEASAGNGGGYIGFGTAWPLLKITGRIAGFIVLFAILIIGFLILLNTSLQRLAERGSRFGAAAFRVRNFFLHVRSRRADGAPVSDDDDLDAQVDALVDDDEKPGEQQTLVERKTPDTELASYELPEVKRVRRVKTHLPLDLLKDINAKPMSGDVEANKERIRKALENFGIPVEMSDVHIGPSVTQYTLRPAEGVKLSQIVTLANDLALALAAHPVRIEAPIPGQALVGVEVPNKTAALVGLREVLQSEAFKRKKSNLTVSLGKDVAGMPQVARLDAMPHFLIAGATGSGKSVYVNTLIVSLLYQNQPGDLRFILVDPKRVELTTYDGIPHLLTPVITDVAKTVNALRWAVAEMDRRYRLLSESKSRNIQGFNALPNADKLPYIVIVVDELADLMATAAREVEAAIVRLAQMARAVGIHLVLATQRPSVDVITGLIKANITSRIAFSVSSNADSRTILDVSGAEKLLGNGDMLFISAELSKPKRLQGAFISDEEINAVVGHLRGQAEPEYSDDIVEHRRPDGSTVSGESSDVDDDLYEEAKDTVMRAGKASASLLQRRLRIGYARAARLLDILEEQGVIGPLDGAKPRAVLVGGARGTDEESFDNAEENPDLPPVEEEVEEEDEPPSP